VRGLSVVALAAILLSGCASAPDRDRQALVGAGVGAGVGALVGSATSGPTGLWAGAAIGAVTGGVIGALVKPQACYYRNMSGELWQVPCTDQRVRYEACFVSDPLGGMSEMPCPTPNRYRQGVQRRKKRSAEL